MNSLAVFADTGISDSLIIFLAALSAAVNVFVVYRVMLYRDPMAGRVKALAARRKELKAGISSPRRRGEKREKSMGFMRSVVSRFNLTKGGEARKAATKLSQAGWRSRDALTIYYFARLCCPLMFGTIAVVLLYVGKVVELEDNLKLIISLVAVLIGFYGPDVYIKNFITKRQQKLQKGLPDALDLLVICAEAGQSLDGALTRVADEMETSSPDMSEELKLTAIELGLLPDRRQALENLNNRTNMAAIRGVVNTLLQTEKYGTPLAHSLRVLSAEFRNDRMMRAEAKAARLPATLTVPMILFILPPLFIVLLGPAVIGVVDMFRKLV